MGLPTIYRASDVGAPTLDANKGSLITVLKACLVNGIAARSCAITRDGTVATVTLTGHGFINPSNVTIAGANQAEYNGAFAITVIDANTFTYAVTGTPAIPATGAITAGLPGAGWSVALEDAGAFKIIFRNDSVNGSGRYFRIQDNGIVTSNPAISSSYTNGSRSCVAAICGMSAYSGIDSPIKPFPRVIAGGDLVDAYAYGMTIRKCLDMTSPSSARAWMIVADSRTCHVFTTAVTGTAMPTSNDVPYESRIRGICSFGDIRQLNSSNAITAKAYVTAGYVGSLNVYTGGNAEGTNNNSTYNILYEYGHIYIDSSLENSAHTVKASFKSEYNNDSTHFGGNCAIYGFVEGSYEHYPSPGTLGLSLNKIFIYENLDDPIRTEVMNQNEYRYSFGWIPGFYGCLHTTNPSTSYRLGDELTKVSDNGRDYLIYSLMMYEGSSMFSATAYARLFAIELTDWWA